MSRFAGWRQLSEAQIEALQHGAPAPPLLKGEGSPPTRRKYRNVKTGAFDSRHEAEWAQALRLMEQAGEIHSLVLDKRLLRYAIVVNDKLICVYEADARWRDAKTGALVVADAKSPATRKLRDYAIKIKLMDAVLGIAVKELR